MLFKISILHVLLWSLWVGKLTLKLKFLENCIMYCYWIQTYRILWNFSHMCCLFLYLEAVWLEFSNNILHAVYPIQLLKYFWIKLQNKEISRYNTVDPLTKDSREYKNLIPYIWYWTWQKGIQGAVFNGRTNSKMWNISWFGYKWW